MSGWAILLVGAVLCFLGVGSLHVAILASGFGLGWVLADLFGASVGTTFLVAAGASVIGWVLVTLVFKVAAFFVGVITGSLIGARVAAVLTAGESNIAVTIVLVIAIAVAVGFLADRYRRRVLLWTTAIGGAGLMLSALGLIAPDTLGFLRHPDAGIEQVTSTLLWIALAAGGWITQRALFPRALREERRLDA
jgi:membrane-associated HD superfamily phosphohydrolase